MGRHEVSSRTRYSALVIQLSAAMTQASITMNSIDSEIVPRQLEELEELDNYFPLLLASDCGSVMVRLKRQRMNGRLIIWCGVLHAKLGTCFTHMLPSSYVYLAVPVYQCRPCSIRLGINRSTLPVGA